MDQNISSSSKSEYVANTLQNVPKVQDIPLGVICYSLQSNWMYLQIFTLKCEGLVLLGGDFQNLENVGNVTLYNNKGVSASSL